MTPIIVSIIGAVLAGTALIGSQAAAGRIAAALLLAGVGGGLWWNGTAGGQQPLMAEARTADGAPVVSQVLVKSAERREALAVPFERAVPAADPLLLMLALGLLAAAAARKGMAGLGLAAGATAMGGWAAATWSAAGGTFSGEQAARDQLTALLPDTTILQFTVPQTWTFDSGGAFLATAGAAGVAAVWLGLAGRLGERLRPLAAVGAALAAAACVWQATSVGGFPWRGMEGVMAATAVGTGAAWMLRGTPLLAGSVAGLALAASLVGLA